MNYLISNKYQDWLNGDYILRRKLFFKYVMDKNKLPKHLKIMRDQYIETCGLYDSDKAIIEKKLPDLRYIFIKRQDIF